MSEKDGGSAFPVPAGNWSGGESWNPEGGMALRDYFAGQALIGLCTKSSWPHPSHAEEMARRAYHFADAMLKARAT